MAPEALLRREPLAQGLGDTVVERLTRIIQIQADVQQVYETWRRIEDFPSFMRSVRRVLRTGPRKSSWEARGPLGKRLRWDAAITEDVPNTRLRWQSLAGNLELRGLAEFIPAEGGCVVMVVFEFQPPLGLAGKIGAFLLDVEGRVEEELERLARRAELGYVPEAAGRVLAARRERERLLAGGASN